MFDDLIPKQGRPPVASSSRVWGDSEAEAAGLYESPSRGTVTVRSHLERGRQPLSFDDLVPQQQDGEQSALFSQRFEEFQAPQNAGAIQSYLRDTGMAKTRGPAVDPGVTASVEFQNQGIAAGQRTTPNIRAQMANLISDHVFEDELGNAVYRDPATGNLVEAQSNQHVVMRDPADNRLKVFGRTASTDEGALSAGGRLMGTGFAAGAVTRRPAIPTPSTQQVRASDILQTARPYYNAYDAQGATQVANPTQVAPRIQGAMDNANVPEHLAEEVYKSVNKSLGRSQPSVSRADQLQAEMNWQTITPPPPQPVTLSEMRSAKELVGKSSRSADSRVRQGSAVANREIGDIIRETSPEAAQNLQTADQIFATSKSMRELQNKEAIAGLRTGRAGYGGNAVNSMRQVLSPIVEKAIKGETTGFRPNEIEAMRQIVEGTTGANLLRGIGQMSPSKGIIQTGLTLSTLGVSGVVGAIANKLANVVTAKQIDRLKELVAKRSPAYEAALKKSLDRYENAQMKLVNEPSNGSVAAFIAASRNLSNGLTRDGISVSSADLIRAIQGPMKGPASDEQPEPVGVIDQ
jgi:hypothetical protein